MCWNWLLHVCVCSVANLGFAAEVVLFAANCNSFLKLSCLQRISIRCRIMCFAAHLGLDVKVVLSAANCNSLLKLSCLQQISIRCQIVCSAANLGFAVKFCVLQRIWDSLSKLYCLQRIIIFCRNWVVCNELAFNVELCVLQRISIRCWIVCSAANLWLAAEIKLSAVNQHFLSKSCCLQRNCDSLPELNCLQRINIRCRKRVDCNEVK